ncbi:MAG TPA: rhomboid family intramembrane serine protease [Tepidisphaeraceae bacterium]|jgi:membrane associated rhomboid family serine protease|nr:rhomboid family intramembrane serine protease [Tepidisphaeraceae bacterium]
MGLADRDYYRAEPRRGSFGSMSAWSVTTWLIAINVAVYVVNVMGHDWLYQFGYFSSDTAISQFEVWRFITFQFLHGSIQHLFFNMLALYFFGPMVEQYLGQRKYVAFYLLCGAAGAVSYLLLMVAGLLREGPFTPLVGASAGILGILMAGATRVAPDATVMLIFPPIPMKLRTMAWIFVGIAAYTIFSNGHNAGGEAAHLGGAALGYLLIQRPDFLNYVTRWPKPRSRGRGMKMDDWR